MKKIQVPTKEQVDAKAQQIFGQLEQNLGMVPNLYATIGYSSNVLEGFLGFSQAVAQSSFTKKEGEAIKLAVSETNQCQYCTAAHTALAKMNGFSEQDTIDIRKGTVADERLNVLVNTAHEITKSRGRISDETKERFFEQGFDEKALVDLVALVNLTGFTNFLHNATQIPVDFPAVPTINHQAA